MVEAHGADGGAESAAEPTGGRGVLDGAFALLDALCELGETGLTRLATATGLPKATVHRLLRQLTAIGAVEKTTGRYRLGPRVFWLGQAWRPDPALIRAAQGPMRGVVRATGATVGVCVLGHGRVITAGGVTGELAQLVPVEPGIVNPQSSAAGRTLWAWSAQTAALSTTATLSATQATRIREAGRVVDDEEILPGVSCVAVPLHGAQGAVLCAMVGASSYPLPRLGATLERASALIGAALR